MPSFPLHSVDPHFIFFRKRKKTTETRGTKYIDTDCKMWEIFDGYSCYCCCNLLHLTINTFIFTTTSIAFFFRIEIEKSVFLQLLTELLVWFLFSLEFFLEKKWI